MNNNKYLPLGSVVLLTGAKKRIMVIGYLASSEETGDKEFDYMGCLYPEGVLSSEQTLVFDHSQIEKIYSEGFVDEEAKEFKEKLDSYKKPKEDLISSTNQAPNLLEGLNFSNNNNF